MPPLKGRFGYRVHPKRVGDPLQPVEIAMEPPKRFQKVRIRYLSSDLAGLEEWVPRGRLVVPWDEAEAFSRDEQNKIALLSTVDRDMSCTIPYEAIHIVFMAAGQKDSPFLGWTTSEANLLRIEDFEVMVKALNLPRETLLAYPHAFVDRCRVYWGPYAAAEDLAKRLCGQSPRPVLDEVSKEEADLRSKAVHATNRGLRESAEESLAARKPVFALVREWCGGAVAAEFDEIRALQEEIARLRRLVESVAYSWSIEGHQGKAAKLLKDLAAGSGEQLFDKRAAWRPATETEYGVSVVGTPTKEFDVLDQDGRLVKLGPT